jgi:RNA polymerase primary sigma factor
MGRLSLYVRDGRLLHSRLRRIVSSVVADEPTRHDLESALLQALHAAGITVEWDTSDTEDTMTTPNVTGSAATLTVTDADRPTTPAIGGRAPVPVVAGAGRGKSSGRSWTPVLVKGDDAHERTVAFNSEQQTDPAPPSAGDETADEAQAVDHGTALDEARRLLALARNRPQKDRIRMLLTAEQEVGLALLTRDEGIPLSTELPEDHRRRLPDDSAAAQAFDALIIHNIRLVWSIAQRYIGQADGLTADDLAAYGQLGLIRAVQKFDATKGFKFSTYATWWIRQGITRAIGDFGRLIRIPMHLHERLVQTRAAYLRLLMHAVRPTVRRLAAETGFSEAEVTRHLELMRGIHSLDAPAGEDGVTLKDYLANRTEDDGRMSGLDLLALQDAIAVALGMLSEREAGVVRLRWGFFDGETWTLDEIGRVYGVTRERIRQIESKALLKLRQSEHIAPLHDWAR